MPLPRHFSKRPRVGLRPPPHPNQVVEVATEPVVVAAPVEDPVVVEPAASETASESQAPKWSMLMKKPELVSIAQGLGLTVPDEATKAQIIALLDAHAAGV